MSLFGNTTQRNAGDGDDIFDAIGNAEVNEGGVYFDVGIYPLCQLNLMKMIRGDEDSHHKIVAEFDILESHVESRPAGTRVGWVRDMDGRYPKIAAGEVKALLAAILDVSDKEIDAATSKAAVSSQNPAHGRLVRVEAYRRTDKKTGELKNFVNTRFFPVSEELQKKATQIRESAGLPPF